MNSKYQIETADRVAPAGRIRQAACVRHQMIWDYFRFDLEEDWPHLIVDDYAAAFR